MNPRRLGVSVGAAIVTGLVLSSGCSLLLDAPSPSSTSPCASTSDCPSSQLCFGSVCQDICASALDCKGGTACLPVAGGSVCLVPPAGDPADGEAPSDAAWPSETADGDVCSTECPVFGVCKASTCDPPLIFGYSSDGDDHVVLLTEQFIECVEITVPSCGYVTGVGISLHTPADINAQFRFGIYGDALQGHLGPLKGQTDEEPISGIHADLMTESAIPMDCGPTAQSSSPIWICLVSSSMNVDIELNAESSAPWAYGGTPTEVSDYLSSGFQGDPTSNYSTGEAPLIYAWFAYSQDQ